MQLNQQLTEANPSTHHDTPRITPSVARRLRAFRRSIPNFALDHHSGQIVRSNLHPLPKSNHPSVPPKPFPIPKQANIKANKPNFHPSFATQAQPNNQKWTTVISEPAMPYIPSPRRRTIAPSRINT